MCPHVEIVVHDYHWCVATSTLAFHLDNGELSVLRRFPGLNSAQVAAHRVEDVCRTTQHAGRRGAHLHEVFANWFAERHSGVSDLPNDGMSDAPIEHGIESRDFVDTHRGHFEQFGHVVHNAYARPALVLPLSQVKEGDDSRLLVLGRVVRYNFVGA